MYIIDDVQIPEVRKVSLYLILAHVGSYSRGNCLRSLEDGIVVAIFGFPERLTQINIDRSTRTA